MTEVALLQGSLKLPHDEILGLATLVDVVPRLIDTLKFSVGLLEVKELDSVVLASHHELLEFVGSDWSVGNLVNFVGFYLVGMILSDKELEEAVGNLPVGELVFLGFILGDRFDLGQDVFSSEAHSDKSVLHGAVEEELVDPLLNLGPPQSDGRGVLELGW